MAATYGNAEMVAVLFRHGAVLTALNMASLRHSMLAPTSERTQVVVRAVLCERAHHWHAYNAGSPLRLAPRCQERQPGDRPDAARLCLEARRRLDGAGRREYGVVSLRAVACLHLSRSPAAEGIFTVKGGTPLRLIPCGLPLIQGHETPVHFAAELGHLDCLVAMLDAGLGTEAEPTPELEVCLRGERYQALSLLSFCFC